MRPGQAITNSTRTPPSPARHFFKFFGIARELSMSISGFHVHFKAVTAMSPLQLQKQLRLQEARRLMLNENIDAAEAGFCVGYDDVAHFNREYKRTSANRRCETLSNCGNWQAPRHSKFARTQFDHVMNDQWGASFANRRPSAPTSCAICASVVSPAALVV